MNVIVTFIYEDVCKFLPEWVDSVNRQTTDEISVLVFSDGVSDAAKYFSQLRFDCEIVDASGPLADIRIDALAKLSRMPFENIVFQDADDLMSDNRVEVSARYLKEYDIVVSELSLIDENGKLYREQVWSERLENGFSFDAKFIRKWNIVGLGNVAIRRSLLENEAAKPKSPLVAVDWFIFYQLMMKAKAKAIFTNECQVFYRQHESNLAGIGKLSKEKLERAISVKKLHYQALKSVGYDFQNEIDELYKINTERFPKEGTDLNMPPFWWEETEWYEKN